MIHYALRCEAAHEFDGWFKDSATFEKMASRALVECPVCASTTVSRALMAPAVVTSRRDGPAAAPAPAAAAGPAAAPRATAPAGKAVTGPVPAALYAALQRMRAEIEKHCDYVGADFAAEARRIHAGESEARGIYGEASPEDADALREEGIAVQSIPWVPRADG